MHCFQLLLLQQRPSVNAGGGSGDRRVFRRQEGSTLPQNVRIATESRLRFHFKRGRRLRRHRGLHGGQLLLQRLKGQRMSDSGNQIEQELTWTSGCAQVAWAPVALRTSARSMREWRAGRAVVRVRACDVREASASAAEAVSADMWARGRGSGTI